jgi:glycosidase
MQTRPWIALLAAAIAFTAQAAGPGKPSAADPYAPVPYVRIQHPEWSKDAVLYELNLRQFTPEGTLAAAERQLPRLKALGIDIVWLMPIHPIGQKNRKGGLGSPYSVRDYRAVNPEFGTFDDLKRFVARAHELGLHVILDWVANHSAWDNPLVAEHPDWYSKDWKGQYHPTSWNDWADIIEFDYDQPGLRRYMTESMEFWVREAGIDGFRCDVAGFVPLDFWEKARAELDRIKPVFMLAEWQATDLHARAFDATYAWDFYSAAHDATVGGKGPGPLRAYYSTNDNAFPHDAFRMTFVSNHDKNSWEATEFEGFGPGLQAAMVLSVVGEGIPLVYNGQEAGNAKRLAFFERDPIEWREHPNGELYRRLIALKKAHTALWNGHWGARMIDVTNGAPGQVLSFVRENASDKVLAVFNFSAAPVKARLTDGPYAGRYTDWSSGARVVLEGSPEIELPAWGYRVFVR